MASIGSVSVLMEAILMYTQLRENVLGAIPSPQLVREDLSRNLIENRLLRQLLRIAEKASEEQTRRVDVEQREGSRQPCATG